MPDEIVEELSEIKESIKDVRNWLRLMNQQTAKSVLEDALTKDWERRLYESLDGETPTRKLVEEVPVSRVTIMKRLKDWRELGVVSQGKHGRYDKIISLETLGIDIQEGKE